MAAGDVLVGKDGERTAVDGVETTGEWARVNNMRVADYHTYFIGDDDWGFSVWAHNTTEGCPVGGTMPGESDAASAETEKTYQTYTKNYPETGEV